jgi:Tol biopolymer transport system component
MRPDGSARRNITNTPDYNEIGGRFSPDGKKILYRRIPPSVKVHHDWWGRAGELVVAGADGAKPVACLTRTGIEIRDLATRQVVRTLERKGTFQQLYWSPDGRWFTATANAFGEAT